MAGLITDTKLKEIADAIRTKKGTTEPIVAYDFPTEILSIESVISGDTPTVYTGHADIEGLKAIGWTDEDIAYYQEHGVNWMEEFDYVHKVPQSDIDLYVKNGSYDSNMIYLPKIDTSTVTDFAYKFDNYDNLVSIPMIDTSKGTNFNAMFHDCTSLTTIPLLDTSNGTSFGYYDSIDSINEFGTFANCTSLIYVPQFDLSNGTNFHQMFRNCSSLTSIPLLNTSQGTNFREMFHNCTSLESLQIDITSHNSSTNSDAVRLLFNNCISISELKIKGVKLLISIPTEKILNKHSLIYTILNSNGRGALHLGRNNYDLYYQDVDILAALMRSKCSIAS